MGQVYRAEVIDDLIADLIGNLNRYLVNQEKLNQAVEKGSNAGTALTIVLTVAKLIGDSNDLGTKVQAAVLEFHEKALRKSLLRLRKNLERAKLQQSNPRAFFIIKARKRMPKGKF